MLLLSNSTTCFYPAPLAQCLFSTCLTNLSDSPFFPLHRILLVGAEIGSFQHRATQSILLYLSPDLVPRYATAPACRFHSSSSTPRPPASARSPSATVTSGSAGAQAGRDGAAYQGGSFPGGSRQQWYRGASNYPSYYGSPYYRSWLQRTAMGAEVQRRQNWQNLMQFQQSFAAQAEAEQEPKTQSANVPASSKKTVFNLLPHCKEAQLMLYSACQSR